MRLGMRYVKGLRQEIALEIVRQRDLRAFASIDDLKQRVPEIQKSELTALAEVGALNFISGQPRFPPPRRSLAGRARRSPPRPAAGRRRKRELRRIEARAAPPLPIRRLSRMTDEERLVADFRGTGLTVGPHPMTYRRAEMKQRGVRAAIELAKLPDGTHVQVAGAVIARQRPGTAKGFVFLSLEDETGIANAIITPPLFERDHTVVVHNPFLLIEGTLQNQDNVVSVKVERVQPWKSRAPKSPRTIFTEEIIARLGRSSFQLKIASERASENGPDLRQSKRYLARLRQVDPSNRGWPPKYRAWRPAVRGPAPSARRISRETGASSFTASPKSAAIRTSLAISPSAKPVANFPPSTCSLIITSVVKFRPVDAFRMSTIVDWSRPNRSPISSDSTTAVYPAAAI